MDVHPGMSECGVGSFGLLRPPSRGPSCDESHVSSSRSPLLVAVTQNPSIVIFCSSSLLFSVISLLIILFLTYLFVKANRVGEGPANAKKPVFLGCFFGVTLHLVSDAASPIKPFLSAFHSSLTPPSSLSSFVSLTSH